VSPGEYEDILKLGQGSLRAAALSDIGKVRRANEDAFALLPEQGLLIVADGMGGHRGGATASKIVVSVLPKMIEQRLASVPQDQVETISRFLRDAVLDLSRQVRQQSAREPSLAGMGATVVVAWVKGKQAFIAHMGDSRAYLYRQGKLKQLTDDHSVVGILLRQGEITPEEARVHPARNQVTRCVGMEGEVYPDVQTLLLSAEDRLLLCTDGLTGMVRDEGIAEILARSDDPQIACGSLVDAANAAGGHDNVTVLVADWRTSDARYSDPRRS
jgi:protein phosphatase